MAADWSPAGGPPGNADTAILLAGATVAEGNPQQVNQLQIATGALLLASNTLSVTGRVANAGAILDSGILTVAGSSVTLTGSGQFGLLDNAPAASIAATAPGDMLLNGSTITGGSIGAGGLILSNLAGGVIAAAPLAGSAATLTLNTGTNSIASSGLIEALAKGTLLLQSPVFNSGLLSAAQGNGRVEANCGSLIFQGAMSAGSLAADAGSTLELKPNWYAASGAIAAIDSGLLRIDVTDTGGSFSSVGSLSLPGLLSGQTILVAGTLAGGGSFPGFDHIRNDGTALTFTGGGQTLGSIAFAAGTANLSIGTDANNDAVIIACYAAGTRIATPDGPVAIEHLCPSDLVISGFGGAVPVRWLGHREVACSRHLHPETVWPVRIRPDAFADDVPCRDLLLSPDHAVHAEGVLIPIRCLVNGRSIVQQAVRKITYWHLELPAHDIVLA